MTGDAPIVPSAVEAAQAQAPVTAPEATKSKKEPTQEELESMRGTDTPIEWRGLIKAFYDIAKLYKLPIEGYEASARWVNTRANVEKVGRLAFIKMPVSLIFKHGSNFAYSAVSEYKAYERGNKQSRFVYLSGLAAAGTAAYYLAPVVATSYVLPIAATYAPSIVLAAASALPAVVATAGTWAVGIAALTVVPVLPIAFSLGVIGAATAAGSMGSLLALKAVRANFSAGWQRTVFAWKGGKIDPAQLPPPKKEDSIRLTEEDNLFRTVYNAVQNDSWGEETLSKESQRRIYESLKAKFEGAAAQANGGSSASSLGKGRRPGFGT